MLPEASPEGTEVLVLYDLRDPDAWGRSFTVVYPWGLDYVLIAFRPGGAIDAPLEDSA
jgi:hypothetical protein